MFGKSNKKTNLFLLTLLIFSLAGCTTTTSSANSEFSTSSSADNSENETSINFSIGYAEFKIGGSNIEYHDVKLIFYDESTWNVFINQRTDLVKIKNIYNQAYFQDKSLLFYSVNYPSSGGTTEVNKITKTENEIIMYLDVITGIQDALSSGIIICEVAKSDIGDRNIFQVKENILLETSTELIKNGAYFITNKSWEAYARNWAYSVRHIVDVFDKTFIQKAIEEALTIEDTSGLFLDPPIRARMWIAIKEDKLTFSDYTRSVYTFVQDVDFYYGETLNSTISFKLINDILTVTMNGGSMQFFFDTTYVVTPTELATEAPRDIEFSSGGSGLNYAYFTWPYQGGFGFFGTSIEIKKAAELESSLVGISHPYHNTMVVQLERNDFSEGTNVLRFRNLGGPTITNTKQIVTYLASDYTVFNVLIAADNTITIEKVLQ